MNKIIFAAIALALSSSAALAENPYVGEPAALAQQDRAERALGESMASVRVDHRATAAIGKSNIVYHDGSAHRFGDASPSSY